MDDLDYTRNVFNEVMTELMKEEIREWDSLSKDMQLIYFCAVIRLLCKGELDDKRSYRGVLYSTFGFGPEAYVRAQNAGFLAIHNMLFDGQRIRDLIQEFANKHLSGYKDSAKQKAIDDFMKAHYF